MENRLKILVVDDTQTMRNIIKKELEPAGYEVVEAANGIEVLKIIETSTPPDLITLDIEMPFLNGYELAQKVREEIKNTEIPILALSTRCSEADIEKGKVCGFNHHMEKFKKFEVADKVVEILGVR